MKLSARSDIDAPIDAVFAQILNAAAYERGAARRGAQLVRSGTGPELVQGEKLDTSFQYRGRQRNVSAEIRTLKPAEQIIIDARTGGLDVVSVVNLVALSPRRTRLDTDINLKPQTLSARLVVQSLKLTRGSIERRLKKRFQEIARTIETRCRA